MAATQTSNNKHRSKANPHSIPSLQHSSLAQTIDASSMLARSRESGPRCGGNDQDPSSTVCQSATREHEEANRQHIGKTPRAPIGLRHGNPTSAHRIHRSTPVSQRLGCGRIMARGPPHCQVQNALGIDCELARKQVPRAPRSWAASSMARSTGASIRERVSSFRADSRSVRCC